MKNFEGEITQSEALRHKSSDIPNKSFYRVLLIDLHFFIHVGPFQPQVNLDLATQLYQPRDRRLQVKLVPTLENRGCHVVSVTDPYGRILGFLDRSR
jgi:hypothetical protein